MPRNLTLLPKNYGSVAVSCHEIMAPLEVSTETCKFVVAPDTLAVVFIVPDTTDLIVQVPEPTGTETLLAEYAGSFTIAIIATCTQPSARDLLASFRSKSSRRKRVPMLLLPSAITLISKTKPMMMMDIRAINPPLELAVAKRDLLLTGRAFCELVEDIVGLGI